MLVEARWRASGAAWRPRQLNRGVQASITTEFRHHMPVRGMIGAHRLVDIEHRPSGQSSREHAAGQLIRVLIGEARGQFFGQRVPMADAGAVSCEPGIAAISSMSSNSQNFRKAGSLPAATKISQVRVWNLE